MQRGVYGAAQATVLQSGVSSTGLSNSRLKVLTRVDDVVLQDWKHHKPYCRPGAPMPASEGAVSATDLDEVARKPLQPADEIRRPKKQYVFRVHSSNMPDGIIGFTSSTISPALLREVRDNIVKEAEKSKPSALV